MNWLVFRTPAQKEKAAEIVLSRSGFQVFLPTKTKVLRKRGKRKAQTKHYPLMASYLFIGVPEGSQPPWHLFRKFQPNLLHSVVGFAGAPAVLNDAHIAQLAKVSGRARPELAAPNPHQAFAVGDLARVALGGFEGHEFTVEDIRGERAKALFEMLGGKREVWFALEDLEAA